MVLPRRAKAQVVVPNNPEDGPLSSNPVVAQLLEDVRGLLNSRDA